MIIHEENPISYSYSHEGKGLVNNLINKLPFELHLPGYNYCGPGTKLQKRLAKGDIGVNPLDEACKEHDIAYSNSKDINQRHIADRILADKAWQRVKATDARLGERINAWLVTNTMKVKTKLGMGCSNRKKRKPRIIKKNAVFGKKLFRQAIHSAKSIIRKKKPESISSAIDLALKAAKKIIKGKKSKVEAPRVISVPKIGGILPLLPIFAGLSAIGALTGGASQIAKAVNAAKSAKSELAENVRHNKQMEAVAMGKGLYLKPYKKGLGLYLSPQPKNF